MHGTNKKITTTPKPVRYITTPKEAATARQKCAFITRLKNATSAQLKQGQNIVKMGEINA